MRLLLAVVVVLISLSATETTPVAAQVVIVEKIEDKATFVERGDEGPAKLHSLESRNVVVNLAISRFEELQFALVLDDKDKAQFESLVSKARRNRKVSHDLLKSALQLNLNDPKEPPDVSGLVEDGIKAETAVTADIYRWIETLSEKQRKTFVKFVAEEERGIEIIRLPFVASYLEIDKRQASRLSIAFTKRERDHRKLLKSVEPLSQPSARIRLKMIKGDAMVYNELTLKQLDKTFRILNWIGADETTKDFIAKLGPPPRDVLVGNATNMRRVWNLMKLETTERQ